VLYGDPAPPKEKLGHSPTQFLAHVYCDQTSPMSATAEHLLYSRVSSGMPGRVLSPNNCPFAWKIWAPSNRLGPRLYASLGPPEFLTKTASRSVQLFCTSHVSVSLVVHVGACPSPQISHSDGGSGPHRCVVPWVHPTQHQERHLVDLDWFSRLCTAHGKRSLYFKMGIPPFP